MHTLTYMYPLSLEGNKHRGWQPFKEVHTSLEWPGSELGQIFSARPLYSFGHFVFECLYDLSETEMGLCVFRLQKRTLTR